jgi:23S rRNA (uridine2552-2'-O)-methyltransferase
MFRVDKKEVKTAKGRKISSTNWLRRQLNDPYVQQSKKDGYRSRAAYKLKQINEKFKLIKENNFVIDLGCAPGSWLQVIKEVKNVKTIGLDLQDIEPIAGIDFIQGDFTDYKVQDQLIEIMQELKADVIVSDMAASSSGIAKLDHDRIIMLCEMVFEFAFMHLKVGGSVAVKILRGGAEQSLLAEVKRKFGVVKHFKPQASRSDSAEMYLIAQNYRP